MTYQGSEMHKNNSVCNLETHWLFCRHACSNELEILEVSRQICCSDSLDLCKLGTAAEGLRCERHSLVTSDLTNVI